MAPQTERVIGRYALYGEIAAGGMATVHYGRLLGPVGFSRTVAVKRLHPQFAKDPEFAAMFLDEARLAARVQHPNVVSTLDVVALEGELFLVLEYVAGESLARVMRDARSRGEAIPLRVAMSIAIGALHGLHAAHEATNEHGEPLTLVHRDISPQNVLVGADGVARLLDFGVAKAIGRTQTTREGQLKGKFAYMSPEQVRGDPLDRRSDIYSMGVVLWEVLTGRRLFEADNDATLCLKIIEGASESPSAAGAEVSPAIDAIVMRALASSADDRFPTARDMAVALEEATSHASPRQVGEWLASVAGDALDRRARRVQEIESIKSSAGLPPRGGAVATATAVDDAPVAAGSVSKVTTVELTGASQPSPRSRWRTFAVLALGAVGLAAVAVGARALLASPHDADSTDPANATRAGAAPPASSVAPPATAIAAPTAAPEPTATAAASAPTDRERGSVATSSSEAPRASARPAARPAAPAPRAAPHAARPDCNPPYVVDAEGIRKIKPECL